MSVAAAVKTNVWIDITLRLGASVRVRPSSRFRIGFHSIFTIRPVFPLFAFCQEERSIMQQPREPLNRVPPAKPNDQRRIPPLEGRLGIRGCVELIIKLIIALIIIINFLANLSRQGEIDLLTLIFLLLLLALLIWLILRQRHLVLLTCNLTKPTGCVHGDTTLLSGHVLEPIVGTASGLGFSSYTLEVVWNSTTSIPAAVIYADGGGNPDTSLSSGAFQVTNGTLGFVDIQQAVLGAGAGFLTSTDFEVRLHVHGSDGSVQTCTIAFQIASARAHIKLVGAAWSNDVTNAAEPLRRSDSAAADLAAVGGSISVRGAAAVTGCAGEKITELHLWGIPDPTFGFAQPANGTAVAPAPSWILISEVIYTADDQRDHNRIDGTPFPDYLTYAAGWTVRTECVIFDLGVVICFVVPDIQETTWASPASGKYTLLLQVKDDAGNTYYDVQRAWIDNETIDAQITNIGGLAPCIDLHLKDYVGTTVEICGRAWDPPIVTTEPQALPNENFGSYSLGFQKNGGAGGTIPAATPTSRVPGIWPGPLAATDEDLLSNWDIVNALDAASPTPTPGIPAAAKLPRGERCAYVISLHVEDVTMVGDGGVPHWNNHLYAINIINDIE
jgi:hypothetical protein